MDGYDSDAFGLNATGKATGRATGAPEAPFGQARGQDSASAALMAARREPAAAQQLRAYWEALRGLRLVPLRSELDPRGIQSALEHTFVIERISPQAARIRLAGIRLNALMGLELRGMPLTAMFTPAGRERLAQMTEACFSQPAIVSADLQAETGFGRPALGARLLMLPLRSDLGDISRALGCLVTTGEIGRSPRRFSVLAERIQPLQGLAQGETRADPLRLAQPQPQPMMLPPGLAASQSPFAGPDGATRPLAQLSPEERRALLRVVR